MKGDARLIIPSVLLALILWGFVIARGQSTVWLDVPVQFMDIPAGLVITDASSITVRVSVSGHERFISGLAPSDIEVKTSLDKIKKGAHVHVVRRDDITLPGALKVSGLSPSVLHLQVVETRNKSIPIRAEVTGLPAEGYAVREIKVQPESVRLEGTRDALKNMELVSTKPVDISGAMGNVEVMVDLNMKEGLVSSHGSVMVSVVITKENE